MSLLLFQDASSGAQSCMNPGVLGTSENFQIVQHSRCGFWWLPVFTRARPNVLAQLWGLGTWGELQSNDLGMLHLKCGEILNTDGFLALSGPVRFQLVRQI